MLLGFALAFAWLFALQVVEDPFSSGSLGDDASSRASSRTTRSAEDFGGGDFDEDFGGGEFDEDFGDGEFDEDFGGGQFDETDEPSASTIGWLSVAFGAGYLALTRLFDKPRLVGTATPFVVAGHIALITGISALSDDLGTTGVGIVLVVAGVLVARVGAVGGRRLTTIIGAVEIGLGALIVLGDSMEDASATSFGTALFVLGAAIAGLAQVLHMSTGEPPQTTPGPSSFPGWAQAGKRVSTAPAGTAGPGPDLPAGGASGPWAGPPAGGASAPWAGPPVAPEPWTAPPAGGPPVAGPAPTGITVRAAAPPASAAPGTRAVRRVTATGDSRGTRPGTARRRTLRRTAARAAAHRGTALGRTVASRLTGARKATGVRTPGDARRTDAGEQNRVRGP